MHTGQRCRQGEEPKYADRRHEHFFSANAVCQTSADERTEKQAERAGTEERAKLVRRRPEFRADARRRDSCGLQIDALA